MRGHSARNGNPVQGENPNVTYLERRTHLATTMLGIVDYDVNKDGWVQLSQHPGKFANLTIEDLGDSVPGFARYIPHVSVRHHKQGCVRFTAKNLRRMPVGKEKRTARIVEAIDTNTCRSEPPEADVDMNGIPDNQQPIYRARKGDAAKGEKSTLLYLERNVHAAEAILELSDFDKDNDGWAIIGRINVSQVGSFNNIGLFAPDDFASLLSTDFYTPEMLSLDLEQRRGITPIVAALNSKQRCKIYMPDALDTVKRGVFAKLIAPAQPTSLECI